MTRTIGFLVAALAFCGCASASPRPTVAPVPAPSSGEVVNARALGLTFRLPHDRWSVEDADAPAAVAVVHARGARILVTARPIGNAGFVAAIDAVRREAAADGCTLRGSSRYQTDRVGRRATVSARRIVDGGIEDGEITLLELDGREGGIIVGAWWPETPSTWTVDDVHAIVDSIRPLPGR